MFVNDIDHDQFHLKLNSFYESVRANDSQQWSKFDSNNKQFSEDYGFFYAPWAIEFNSSGMTWYQAGKITNVAEQMVAVRKTNTALDGVSSAAYYKFYVYADGVLVTENRPSVLFYVLGYGT